MANIKTTTENYFVVANGSVFTFKKEILTLEFSNNAGNTNFKINLIFSTNPEKGKKIESMVPESKEYLDINIYNAEGTGGTTEPLQITNDETTGKNMYLSFSFQQFTDYFVVNYTVFEKK
jgi:hypothetical protein